MYKVGLILEGLKTVHEGRVWDDKSLWEVFMKDNSQVEKAAVKLYKLQKKWDEEDKDLPKHKRRSIIAFDGNRDFILSCAEQVIAGRKLSARQIEHLRDTLRFILYRLVDIANGKIKVE